MKRSLSVLLVALMVFSFTATVCAAENSGGSSTINVAGEYSVASTGEVVSVDVGWEEMSFQYTEGEKKWDFGTYSYIGGENGGWSDNKPGITMTNHSNVDVVAELSFTPSASVTGTFYSKSGDTYTALSADEQGANLSAAAEGSAQSAADAKTFYFGISGGAITKNTSLGTITVSISFKPAFNEADLAAFTYTTDSYGRVKITGVKDTSVTELVVPDFVYEIECGALKDCTSLVKLTVPFAGNRSNGEQTYIGYAFGANNYTESGTVLPATLKDITVTGGYAKNDTLDTFAFYDCTNLTNIVIGDGVTYINPSVFVDCISLESLTVPFVGDCKKEITDSYQLPLTYLFGYSTYGTKYTDTAAYDYKEITEKISALQKEIKSLSTNATISSDKISGVYIKYATANDIIPDTPIMACDLLDFVSEHMNENELLVKKMTEDKREKVDSAKADMADAEELFLGNTYSRMIFSVDLPSESEESTRFVEHLTASVKEVFGNDAHVAGEMVSTYDLQKTFDTDNTLISIFTIISIFLIVMLVFRSLSLPVILVAVIQGAIWISMSTSLLTGPMFFMSYIITNCILMGATIDYGILMSTNYVQYRQTLDKKEALARSVEIAIPTVFTSGLILTICGFVVGIISSQTSISTVGFLLGKGTLVSVLMITLVLPSVLYLLDGFILKLSMKKKQ